MTDYYTGASEYSPVATRYQDHQSMPSPVPSQPTMNQHPMANQHPMLTQQPMMPQHPLANQQRPMTNGSQYKYNMDSFQLDFKDILKRAVKYLVEGLAVAFVAYYFVGKGKLDIKDIVVLGITAAFVFAILDTFSPTVSLGARFGAGFGIGQGLFGLNPAFIGGPVVGVL